MRPPWRRPRTDAICWWGEWVDDLLDPTKSGHDFTHLPEPQDLFDVHLAAD
jgi:hypothetical protein